MSFNNYVSVQNKSSKTVIRNVSVIISISISATIHTIQNCVEASGEREYIELLLFFFIL